MTTKISDVQDEQRPASTDLSARAVGDEDPLPHRPRKETEPLEPDRPDQRLEDHPEHPRSHLRRPTQHQLTGAPTQNSEQSPRRHRQQHAILRQGGIARRVRAEYRVGSRVHVRVFDKTGSIVVALFVLGGEVLRHVPRQRRGRAPDGALGQRPCRAHVRGQPATVSR